MPFLIFWLILVILTNSAFSTESIRINSPQISPEREFAYLKNPILQFLRERLGFINITSQDSKEIKVLTSAFQFEPSGRAKIDLTLQKLTTGELIFKRTYETTFEDFWKTLEKGVEEIKTVLHYNSEALSTAKITEIKPLDKDLLPKQTFKNEEPSFFSKINPLNLLSKVIPKKENPLRIKLEVPPPPPPSILNTSNIPSSSPFLSPSQGVAPSIASQTSSTQIQPKSPENIPPSISLPKNNSPWQWF